MSDRDLRHPADLDFAARMDKAVDALNELIREGAQRGLLCTVVVEMSKPFIGIEPMEQARAEVWRRITETRMVQREPETIGRRQTPPKEEPS